MLLFFRIFVWVIFLGLGVYLYYFWVNEEKALKKLGAIRKIWYLVLLFGALLYWSVYPFSLFTSWKNYAIIAGVFLFINAFLFLGLYLRKVGNSGWERVTQSVADNQELLQSARDKMKNVLHILNRVGISGYYGSIELYLEGLKKVLVSYAEKEEMSTAILPFRTSEEKAQALLPYPGSASLQTKLERFETYYNDADHFLLCPVSIREESYIIKLSSTSLVSEIDSTIIHILLSVYDTVVQLLETGGESNG